MGDEWKTEFSREELEAMGETPLETTETSGTTDTLTPAPDSQGTEVKTEEAKTEHKTIEPEETEKKGEEETKGETEDTGEEETPKEGEPVPYDRFAKVYGRDKQHERERDEFKEKLDLFKRNPDEYYTKYPDEKPEDYQKTERKPETPVVTEILPMRKMLGAAVNDPPNPSFHGKTMAELLEMGPEGIAAANDYYQEYVESIRDQVKASKQKEEEGLKSLRDEDNRFMDSRAQELFNKSLTNLDDIQKDKVEKVAKDTLAWMKANKKPGRNTMAYSLEDAFKLMNYEKSLSDATVKGAEGLVKFAKSGTVKSVATSGTKTTTDPYSGYMAMSEQDLADKINDMSEGEYMKFLKEATPTFRQKFPSLPYLN